LSLRKPAPTARPDEAGKRLLLRNISLRFLTGLIAVVATLFLIEGLVRMIPLYPENISTFNPEVGSVYTADAVGVQVNPVCLGAYRQVVQINAKGLRDDEIPYARGNAYRILFLGDSFLESRQIALQDTFHARLENDLGVEIIAGGHGGWGTDNELLWYRQEGYKYQPDLVILLYQPANDVQDNSTTINIVPYQYPHFTLEDGALLLHTAPAEISPPVSAEKTTSQSLHTFLLDHSRLYDLITMRLRRKQIAVGSQTVTASTLSGDDHPASESGGDLRYAQLYNDAFALTFALVNQLRREAEADGAGFLIALASSDVRVRSGTNAREIEALSRLEIEYIDLLPAIQAADTPDNPLHLPCDGHWTLNAHILVADVLAEYLRTRLPIKVP